MRVCVLQIRVVELHLGNTLYVGVVLELNNTYICVLSQIAKGEIVKS